MKVSLYNYDNQEIRIDLPAWPKRIEVKVISGDEVVDFYFQHFSPIHVDTAILNKRVIDDVDMEYELEDHDKIIRFVEFSRENQEIMDELYKDENLILSDYRACLMTEE